MKNEEEMFRYISYAPPGAALKEVIVWSIFYLVILFLFTGFEFFFELLSEEAEPSGAEWPKSLPLLLGMAAFAWLMRGKSLRIDFPRTFRVWLIFTLLFGAMVLLLELTMTLAPTWQGPILGAFLLVVMIIGRLDVIGRANYERLGLASERKKQTEPSVKPSKSRAAETNSL